MAVLTAVRTDCASPFSVPTLPENGFTGLSQRIASSLRSPRFSAEFVQKAPEPNFHPSSPNLQKSLRLMEMGRNVRHQETAQPDAKTQKINTKLLFTSPIKLSFPRYRSVHIVLSSCLVFKFMKIEMPVQKTVILPFILCGCQIWSLTLTQKLRLRVSENRVMRKYSNPTGRK
jgi:hypothetical protein